VRRGARYQAKQQRVGQHLAAGRLRVGEATTDADLRSVDLLPALRELLIEWRMRAPRPGRRRYRTA
jgi:hypothetical protein